MPVRVTDTTPVVWCLADGRPGHRRQLEGLVSQLAERRLLSVHWLDVSAVSRTAQLREFVLGQFSAGEGHPDPNIIIGAGHSIHLATLAARRARGGQIIVLMRPSLPTSLFDLCLVPEHDLLSLSGRLIQSRVVPTRGVLNPFRPSQRSDPSQALMLIGGPSRHHGWCNDDILRQLQEIRRLSPTTVRWTLTTSRRTPASFLRQATEQLCDKSSASPLTIVPVEETPPDWLADRLSHAQTVFVSEDSVSMVYESLTVGADVGLLQVPRRRQSRNSAGIDRLQADRLVVSFDDWCIDRFEHRQSAPFHEASRCADIVCERLLDAA